MRQPYFWSYESHSSNLSICCLKFIPQLSTTKICLFQSCICALTYLFASLCELEWNVRPWSHNTTFYVSRLFCLALEPWSSPSERMSTHGMSLYVSSATSLCDRAFESTESGLSPGSYEPLTTRVHEQAPLIC